MDSVTFPLHCNVSVARTYIYILYKYEFRPIHGFIAKNLPPVLVRYLSTYFRFSCSIRVYYVIEVVDIYRRQVQPANRPNFLGLKFSTTDIKYKL